MGAELDEEQISEIIHEANRLYCKFIGDEVAPPWADAEAEMRKSTIKGVRNVKAKPPNEMPNPMENHNLWMKDKLQEGWRYGEKRDYEKKTHPCLMPYEFLSPEQRLKDTLFLSICYCLLQPKREAAAKAERQLVQMKGGR